jgi:hypothetical protein
MEWVPALLTGMCVVLLRLGPGLAWQVLGFPCSLRRRRQRCDGADRENQGTFRNGQTGQANGGGRGWCGVEFM